MTTEQIGRYRCEMCKMDFDSMERLTEHNVQQSPGTWPDAVPADVVTNGGMR